MSEPFDFVAETEALLRELGAVEPPPRGKARFLLMHTKGGPLWVEPYQNFVHGKFEFPWYATGKVAGSLNDYSGKWNWYPKDETPTRDDLAALAARFRKILLQTR